MKSKVMKAYTDLEQSKKLAEILPVKSADMRYSPFGDNMHPVKKKSHYTPALQTLIDEYNALTEEEKKEQAIDCIINSTKEYMIDQASEWLLTNAQNYVCHNGANWWIDYMGLVKGFKKYMEDK